MNYNGTGTIAINDSYNVSSLTDDATGKWDVNFSTAMSSVNFVAVCDGRLVSITYRGEAFNTHSGDATVTFGVETNTVGTSYSSGYSVQETEAITVNNADDQHLWHVVFDSAKHWDSTDMFAISIQSDTDITGSNERIFLTLVIEDDWSTYLAGSTREIDSTP